MTETGEKEHRKIDRMPENISLNSDIDGDVKNHASGDVEALHDRGKAVRSRPIIDEFVEIIPDRKKKKKISDLIRDGFGQDREHELDLEDEEPYEEPPPVEPAPTVEPEYTIKLPEIFKDSIPETFNVSDIGRIDLGEAEAIANEDSEFLLDPELVRGLDELVETLEEETTGGEEWTAAEPQGKDKPHALKTGHEPSEVPAPERGPLFEPVREETVPEKTATVEQPIVTAVGPVKPEQEQGAREPFPEDDRIPENIPGKADSRAYTGKAGYSAPDQDIHGEKAAPVITGIELDEPEEAGQEGEILDDLSIFSTPPEQEAEPVRVEKLQDDMIQLEKADESVVFIDDAIVEREEAAIAPAAGDKQLDRITDEIVEIVEGAGSVLIEAEVEDDKTRIAPVIRGIMPAFEDLLFGYDDVYKYSDEDLDFIHSSIVEDDYSRYLREIDEFYGVTESRGASQTLELFGLTSHDIDLIEDRLFSDEFKGVNLAEAIDYLAGEPDMVPVKRGKENVLYLLPDEKSLLDEEKRSIESDMTSPFALVFEEDVNDIRAQLKSSGGGAQLDSFREEDETSADEIPAPEEVLPVEVDEADLEAGAADETVYDITDRVIIIDDEIDVDRFIKKFPREKQKDMRSLFKYFDGLFEKLPEDTIRSFADSEYFDLYVKVLNDLGI